jgi:nitronate monooxygenase
MADWSRLRLPVMQAPMIIASGLELVLASCRAGVIGSFSAGNPRAPETLEDWLRIITDAESRALDSGETFAPWCVNLPASRRTDGAIRRSRLRACARARAPLVLTNLGDPREEVEAAHDWGGLVFHDVTTMRFAEKAIAAGVDGLMLVCGGAGGHAGTLNPFSFLPQVRRMFGGYILLAGGIADGSGVAAALALGADLAVMGTRFIATREAGVAEAHKAMLVVAGSEDVVFTGAVAGMAASFLAQSIRANGLDPDNLPPALADHRPNLPPGVRPWKTVFSGGHSTGLIDDVPSVATLIDRLEREMAAARDPARWRTALTGARR